MKCLSANEIRKMWLEFFKEKGHSVEPSSPLVPINDNTLLWIGAGVAPLKKYFDGREKPKNPRITNAQKCIRTNDIDNVGKTARHHTFFEMLGNFSIGDYFKEEAIDFGFELLTSKKWFDFPLEKLYFTVYKNDSVAAKKWMSLGVPEDHIIPLAGNFWEIGEGPCGPDTEIFFDRGEKYDDRGIIVLKEDLENDRYIEIWNIVFSQYNSTPGLKKEDYPELPSKNIDTGCGLERLACVMQGVNTNYDTDLFMPMIKRVEEISGVKYEGQMAFKVIADHIRTVTFAISDGATLSNEGRGYVLRRVLRRATKYGKKLGINKPFMFELVDVVCDIMKGFYPYLEEKKDIVKMIVHREEEKFLETLNSGEKKMEEILSVSKDHYVSGIDAFTLFDTYGFPIELTEEMAKEKGFEVDLNGFNDEMRKQKERARNARENVSSMGSQNEEFLSFNGESSFVGYEIMENDTVVTGVFKEGIVLKETPFYATSGGQLADKGTINGIEVVDVIKMPNGQFLHFIDSAFFQVGMKVHALIDVEGREAIRRNHSAAHLLHKSLKLVLGDHVHQQGSQISVETMRFDFNNYTNLTDEQILKSEELVNEAIKKCYPINTKVMPIEEAKKTGAEALFGEKYGNMVRVVDMGYSIEFCGGTHASNTSDLKNFAIISLESIGSGTFRCEAVTGCDVMKAVKASIINLQLEIDAICEKAERIIVEGNSKGIPLSFNKAVLASDKFGYAFIMAKKAELEMNKQGLKEMEKEYKRLLAKNVLGDLKVFESQIISNRLLCAVEGYEMDILKQVADAMLNKIGSGIVFLASVNDDKVIFVCKNNIGLHSGNLVKEAAIITGGNGGGRPDMASAGGKDVSKIKIAMDRIAELIAA